jgi:mannose-6-phosphate isomerase-like protein (cupin superfamily)
LKAAEEIYVALSGSGKVKLDDEIREVRPLDAIRVAPHVARAFEAGPEGLEFIAFGPHHPGDGEAVDDSWVS